MSYGVQKNETDEAAELLVMPVLNSVLSVQVERETPLIFDTGVWPFQFGGEMAKHPCLVHSEIVRPVFDHFKSTEMVRHPCLLIWGVWPFRYSGDRIFFFRKDALLFIHSRISLVREHKNCSNSNMSLNFLESVQTGVTNCSLFSFAELVYEEVINFIPPPIDDME